MSTTIVITAIFDEGLAEDFRAALCPAAADIVPHAAKVGKFLAAQATSPSLQSLQVAISAAAVSAVAASGTFTLTGLPTAGQKVYIGSEVYTFVATDTGAFQIEIGVSATATATAMAAAIEADSTLFDATSLNGVVTVTSKTAGAAGNSIFTSDNAANASWGATTFTGGVDAVDADNTYTR